VVDPSHPETVYAVTQGVLRRTLDGGKTWTRVGEGLPPRVAGPLRPLDQQLAADAGGTLYFATGLVRGAGQIYRSTSRGASWQPAGQGLAAASGFWLLQLAGDVSGPPGLAYATTGRGVYVTSNAGRRWTRTLRGTAYTIGVGPGGVFALVIPPHGQGALYRRGTAGWTRLSRVWFDAFALDLSSSSRMYGWSYDGYRNCARLLGSRKRRRELGVDRPRAAARPRALREALTTSVDVFAGARVPPKPPRALSFAA